ncbi:hypothetical protein EV383_5087 [Pseudonocardia sediminis]|uniref:Uncharacterized protein n=1 Tax=Pseudonocardia sediminis TaxID=1397368 RepID=A0A4V2FRD4_PSEST|nr:hypothetical protein EV383_5087 [Pseudonocardia sediminis]
MFGFLPWFAFFLPRSRRLRARFDMRAPSLWNDPTLFGEFGTHSRM